jgi:ubiquinone/menaquinone biosynthesis C-methylase UbiE
MFRPGGLELTRRMIGLSGLAPGSRLMDAGCGDGDTVRFLTELGYDIRGVDAAIPPDTDAPGESSLSYGTVSSLPCPDAEFDGVLCECVLSLVARPRDALLEFARALRPGGALMLSDIYSRAGGGRTDGYVRYVRSIDEINQMMGACGFVIERFEDRSDALAAMAAQMIMDRGSGGLCEECCMDYDGMRRLKSGYFLLIARTNVRREVNHAGV